MWREDTCDVRMLFECPLVTGFIGQLTSAEKTMICICGVLLLFRVDPIKLKTKFTDNFVMYMWYNFDEQYGFEFNLGVQVDQY